MVFPPTFVPGFHDKNQVGKMKYNILGSTNLLISQLSLGTGVFSYFYGDFSLEECKRVVKEALKSGVNYIDTGPWYGHGVAETILGKCLQNIPRKSYYIGTKVGRYEKDPKFMFDFSAEKTRKSIEKSFERLGLDYIDVIQVHDVEFAPSLDVILNETLPCLQEYVKKGKIGFIGITGYPNSALKELIEKSEIKINTILSYTRLSMFDQSLKEFIPFYKSKNIGIINASVHGMGLLTNFGPQPWHPASDNLKEICSKAAKFCKEQDVELGKLALYFALSQNEVDTILCGTNTTKLLRLNLDTVQFGLSEKELEIYAEVMKRCKHLFHHHIIWFFTKLEKAHWEGVELKKFRENTFSFDATNK